MKRIISYSLGLFFVASFASAYLTPIGGGGGSGASTSLNNLTSPTAVNQDILPGTNLGFSIGSASFRFDKGYVSKFNDSADFTSLNVQDRSFHNSSGAPIMSWGTGTFTISQPTYIDTNFGLQLYNAANTNRVKLRPNSATTDYDFLFPADGGTAGYVLSTDGTGVTSWISASGSGASTALDNLAATAVNANILPGVTNDVTLGNSTFQFDRIFGLEHGSNVADGDSAGEYRLRNPETNSTSSLELRDSLSTITTPSTSLAYSALYSRRGSRTDANLFSIFTETDNTNDGTATPSISIETGNKQDISGDTGRISILTGNPNTGESGQITAFTGDSGNGDSGPIAIRTGGASGLTGNITLGIPVGGTGTGSLRLDLSNIKLLTRVITGAGTTGNQTINELSGTVNLAAAETSITVNNSFVTEDSLIYAMTRTNDTNCSVKNIVAAAGSFAINMTLACAAETSVGFLVTN
jgi:hypothetical protein